MSGSLHELSRGGQQALRTAKEHALFRWYGWQQPVARRGAGGVRRTRRSSPRAKHGRRAAGSQQGPHATVQTPHARLLRPGVAPAARCLLLLLLLACVRPPQRCLPVPSPAHPTPFHSIPFHSTPLHSNPIQSNPIQSNPIQAGPTPGPRGGPLGRGGRASGHEAVRRVTRGRAGRCQLSAALAQSSAARALLPSFLVRPSCSTPQALGPRRAPGRRSRSSAARTATRRGAAKWNSGEGFAETSLFISFRCVLDLCMDTSIGGARDRIRHSPRSASLGASPAGGPARPPARPRGTRDETCTFPSTRERVTD
eukprot:scaffold1540_cov359-Prasinococcus_capsulatus_cf.AAC.4